MRLNNCWSCIKQSNVFIKLFFILFITLRFPVENSQSGDLWQRVPLSGSLLEPQQAGECGQKCSACNASTCSKRRICDFGSLGIKFNREKKEKNLEWNLWISQLWFTRGRRSHIDYCWISMTQDGFRGADKRRKKNLKLTICWRCLENFKIQKYARA